MRVIAAELAFFLGERGGGGTQVVAALICEEDKVKGAAERAEKGMLFNERFGLYQLVVNGHTDGWEFEQLDSVVYERLKHAYAVTN